MNSRHKKCGCIASDRSNAYYNIIIIYLFDTTMKKSIGTALVGVTLASLLSGSFASAQGFFNGTLNLNNGHIKGYLSTNPQQRWQPQQQQQQPQRPQQNGFRGDERDYFNQRGNHQNYQSNNSNNNNWYNRESNDPRSVGYYDQADASTSITVNSDGTSTLRGARVTSTSGTTITVTETLGSVTLTWTVNAGSNPQVQGKDGRSMQLSDITVGDIVTVTGQLQTGSTYAVNATLIRDVSRIGGQGQSQSANQQQMFEGTLVTTTSSLPATVTVNVRGTQRTVNLTTTTSVLNKDWNTISLGSFVAGDTVRVFGYLPNGSSTISALVIRNTTR